MGIPQKKKSILKIKKYPRPPKQRGFPRITSQTNQIKQIREDIKDLQIAGKIFRTLT